MVAWSSLRRTACGETLQTVKTAVQNQQGIDIVGRYGWGTDVNLDQACNYCFVILYPLYSCIPVRHEAQVQSSEALLTLLRSEQGYPVSSLLHACMVDGLLLM
jgi:hypothetical protein